MADDCSIRARKKNVWKLQFRATGKHVFMLTGVVIETPVKSEYTLNRWHEVINRRLNVCATEGNLLPDRLLLSW